jgi:hypothetical protein
MGKWDKDWEFELVPADAVRIFRMAWQFENWLRLMVYVEVRAAMPDWATVIKELCGWTLERDRKGDKKLHHMATAHDSDLSYSSFGKIWNFIKDDVNWPMFKAYFPPKDIVAGRMEEAMAIRNRMAHFREPHKYDVNRFEQLLRDMEGGISGFCLRYAVGRKFDADPVATRLEEIWEKVGYAIELKFEYGKYLYAVGTSQERPRIHGRIQVLPPQCDDATSAKGLIYKLTITTAGEHFDTRNAFNVTRDIHPNTIHLMLEPAGDQFAVTIPAILGTETVVETMVTCDALQYASLVRASGLHDPFVELTEPAQLDRFLQCYAVEAAKLQARRQGHGVSEQQLEDGSVRLTVQVGG